MAAAKTWLDVPYGEKDEAKAAGARWDPRVKRWYTHGDPGPRLARWVSLPELLPGPRHQPGPLRHGPAYRPNSPVATSRRGGRRVRTRARPG